MSAATFPSFCLIFCLSMVCSSGDQKIITAELGQDVILPCKVPNNNIGINNIAVEWSRPEMDPEYVLLYRYGHFDTENQHPSYQNRVDLQDKEMKDGDVSLILKNVKMEDTGRYECRVFENGNKDPISNISLEVHPPALKIITAELGQDVILPCKVPNKYNINNIVVEWIRPDLDPDHILFYRDGHIDPDNQHPSYQNRVDLQDKDMKDGDFSMILKNVTMEDNGRHECRVFQRGSNRKKRSILKVDPISIINLEVHPSGEKFEGDKGGGDNVGIIAGSVVAVILLAVLASVGFLIYRFRSTRQNRHVEVPLDERPVA